MTDETPKTYQTLGAFSASLALAALPTTVGANAVTVAVFASPMPAAFIAEAIKTNLLAVRRWFQFFALVVANWAYTHR